MRAPAWMAGTSPAMTDPTRIGRSVVSRGGGPHWESASASPLPFTPINDFGRGFASGARLQIAVRLTFWEARTTHGRDSGNAEHHQDVSWRESAERRQPR